MVEKEQDIVTSSPNPIGKRKEVKNKSSFYPVSSQGNFIETFHDLVANDMENLIKKDKEVNMNKGAGYLSKNERQALTKLKNNQQIVIRSADKGGGIVVQDYTDYHFEALKILSDPDYYVKIDYDPFPAQQKTLEAMISQALANGVVTKKESSFILITCPNKPFYYHLPKVHKDLKKPPGRPIISGINSCPSNLSHFVDLFLQDYVVQLPSHLKDSDSLIRILNNLTWFEGLHFLTLDVTALYSNIGHEKGIECIEEFFVQDSELLEGQKSFLLDAIRFILMNNFFAYDGGVYHQIKGTAMGTRMAPSYANLFMGSFESKFIMSNNPYLSKIILYKRFIDDLFILWDGNEEEAKAFVEILNSNPWDIKFTLNFGRDKIEFLDLVVSHDSEKFITSTYFKAVDINSYLDYSSGHFKKWKQNVPYGQFRRVRKNCTNEKTFEVQSKTIAKRFLDKGYPKKLVQDAFEKAKALSQQECLEVKNKSKKTEMTSISSCVNFITTYSTSHKIIQSILRKYWYILQRDPYLKTSILKNPRIIYRRPPTLKSILAPSRLKQHRQKESVELTKGIFRCGKARCLCCREIAHKEKTFVSTQTGESFNVDFRLSCQSAYVIYLVQCICGKQYIGRTTQKLHMRINKHRANIKKKFQLHGLSRHCAALHADCNNPYKVYPIDHIKINIHDRFEQLKKREVFWMYRLKTLQPMGLNEVSEAIIQ